MFDKILLAIDGSEGSNRAVEAAAGLVVTLGSEVVVVHVRERTSARSGAFDLETHEEASDFLDQTVRALKDRGINARGELARGPSGSVGSLISECAKVEGADLVVMGSRGLSNFAGMLVGSVTHRVLHSVDIPVLIVR